jgi:sterol 24-C-methyltransferase
MSWRWANRPEPLSVDEIEHGIITADPALRVERYGPMVRCYYECITTVYRRFWGDSYHFALFRGSESREEALSATEEMIADEGSFRPGLRILDFGSGLGVPALHIAEYSGAEIMGIDLCAHHVHIAQERVTRRGMGGKVQFAVADGMYLPFPDSAFDRVYAIEAGCHTPDKTRFCRECARVLRAGGEFLALDWMESDSLTPEDRARYIEPICRYCSLPHMVSLSTMRQYLQDAGLEVLIVEQASSDRTFLRNWEPLEASPNIAGGDWAPETLWRVSRGGHALADAASAGAFIIGHWRAVKPV